MQLEQMLNAKESRRFAAEDRYLARIERREDEAEQMVGKLIRDGKEVFYVYPQGGKYREGSRLELIAFLIRNNYA